MQKIRLRTDLQRVVIRGFALPLGVAPDPATFQPPVQGYTLSFVPGEEDEPDTYSFHVVVSHELVKPVLNRAFRLLPEEVYGIIEIGSRDAYRSTDTYISQEPISRDVFLKSWNDYEPFLLEDSSVGAGGNSEEPFVEVFLDQWKGIAIHVPPTLRDDVESMLRELSLEEVAQTWPEEQSGELGDMEVESSRVRQVLDLRESAPDLDELLLMLRHAWNLELNIDPESNVDEGGRDLGSTLWHAVVIVDNQHNRPTGNGHGQSAYASIWATAGSLNEMEHLIQSAIDKYPQWSFGEIFTIDRVAFDERPDELADLRPSRREPQVHLVTIEPWGEPEQ